MVTLKELFSEKNAFNSDFIFSELNTFFSENNESKISLQKSGAPAYEVFILLVVHVIALFYIGGYQSLFINNS